MSLREHPGRLRTKSAPNAWDGVTKPRGAGSEATLEEISSALLLRTPAGDGARHRSQGLRTHLGLSKDAPLPRAVQRSGAIITVPILSGLHHHYARM